MAGEDIKQVEVWVRISLEQAGQNVTRQAGLAGEGSQLSHGLDASELLVLLKISAKKLALKRWGQD